MTDNGRQLPTRACFQVRPAAQVTQGYGVVLFVYRYIQHDANVSFDIYCFAHCTIIFQRTLKTIPNMSVSILFVLAYPPAACHRNRSLIVLLPVRSNSLLSTAVTVPSSVSGIQWNFSTVTRTRHTAWGPRQTSTTPSWVGPKVTKLPIRRNFSDWYLMGKFSCVQTLPAWCLAAANCLKFCNPTVMNLTVICILFSISESHAKGEIKLAQRWHSGYKEAKLECMWSLE